MTTIPENARATALYDVPRTQTAYLMPVEVDGVHGVRWQDAAGRPLATMKSIFFDVDIAITAARRNGKFRDVRRLGQKRAA